LKFLPNSISILGKAFTEIPSDNFPYRKSLAILLIASTVILAVWLWVLGPFGGVAVLRTQGNFLPPSLWEIFTSFGDFRVLLVFALPFCKRHPRLFWAIVLSLVIGGVFERGIKVIVHLPRPSDMLDSAFPRNAHRYSGHFSFPSGHAVMAFSFVGAFLASWPIWKSFPLLLLACLVGYSRVMLGAHWPIDVLGGAMVGTLSAIIATYASQRWTWGERLGPHHMLVVISLLAVLTLPFLETGDPVTVPLRVVLTLIGTLSILLTYGIPLINCQRRNEGLQ
jgi:membrane-associated phospholipid phosphatase